MYSHQWRENGGNGEIFGAGEATEMRRIIGSIAARCSAHQAAASTAIKARFMLAPACGANNNPRKTLGMALNVGAVCASYPPSSAEVIGMHQGMTLSSMSHRPYLRHVSHELASLAAAEKYRHERARRRAPCVYYHGQRWSECLRGVSPIKSDAGEAREIGVA